MNKKIAAAAAGILALGVASGTAFTDSVTVPDKTAGYGVNTVSGATVSNVDFAYNTDRTGLTDVTLHFADLAQVDGKFVTLTLKTAGADVPLAGKIADSDTVIFSGLTQSVAGLKGIAVSVVDAADVPAP
jgi:hypothetical protein